MTAIYFVRKNNREISVKDHVSREMSVNVSTFYKPDNNCLAR